MGFVHRSMSAEGARHTDKNEMDERPQSACAGGPRWELAASGSSRRSAVRATSEEEVTAEARLLLDRFLQRQLRQRRAAAAAMASIEEEESITWRERHRSYVKENRTDSDESDINENNAHDVINLLDRMRSPLEANYVHERLGGGELPQRTIRRRYSHSSGGDRSSRENSVDNLLVAAEAGRREARPKSNPDAHSVRRAVQLINQVERLQSADDVSAPAVRPQSLFPPRNSQSSGSPLSTRVSRDSNGNGSRASVVSSSSAPRQKITRKRISRQKSLLCTSTDVISDYCTSSDSESQRSSQQSPEQRKKKSQWKRVKERLKATFNRSNSKDVKKYRMTNDDKQRRFKKKHTRTSSEGESAYFQVHGAQGAESQSGTLSSRGSQSPSSSKRHSVDSWLHNVRRSLAKSMKSKKDSLVSPNSPKRFRAPTPPPLPPLDAVTVPEPSAERLAPLARPVSVDLGFSDSTGGAVTTDQVEVCVVEDPTLSQTLPLAWDELPEEQRNRLLDKIADHLKYIGDEYIQTQGDSLASSLQSEVDELQALMSPPVLAQPQLHPLSEEARQQKIVALGAMLRERGDTLNPALPRQFAQTVGLMPLQLYPSGPLTYDRFRQQTDQIIGQDRSMQHVALLFFIAKQSIALVGMGSQWAAQAKNFTIQYFAEKFASWIVDQGGWDSALQSCSESEMELD